MTKTDSRNLKRAGTLSALTVFLFAAGCNKPETPAAQTVQAAPAANNPAPAAPQAQAVSAVVTHPAFDGERAYAELKTQCDFGPRVLGTPAHEKTRAYFMAELKKYADATVTQDWQYRKMPVSNVIGVFYAAGAKAASAAPVLIAAHWDTRPVADGPNSTALHSGAEFRFGANGWNRTAPIPGANDGASGAAVLLELARLFHEKKPPVGVLLLFIDGEDYGDFRANSENGEGVFLGSRYFAKNYAATPAFGHPNYGILLDMVGAKNLILPMEMQSQTYAPGTVEKVYATALSLGYGDTFTQSQRQGVGDDHIPLNQAGIPTIDLIQPLPFNEYEKTGYASWHTLQDTPDKCSAKSLKIVGDTLAEVIYRETPAP